MLLSKISKQQAEHSISSILNIYPFHLKSIFFLSVHPLKTAYFRTLNRWVKWTKQKYNKNRYHLPYHLEPQYDITLNRSEEVITLSGNSRDYIVIALTMHSTKQRLTVCCYWSWALWAREKRYTSEINCELNVWNWPS